MRIHAALWDEIGRDRSRPVRTVRDAGIRRHPSGSFRDMGPVATGPNIREKIATK